MRPVRQASTARSDPQCAVVDTTIHARYALGMERISTAGIGWCLARLDDDSLAVMVRFAPSETGRLSVAELVIARHTGVTADALRSIRIGRLEAWANGQGKADLVRALKQRDGLDADERAKADSGRRAGHKRTPSEMPLHAQGRTRRRNSACGSSSRRVPSPSGGSWTVDPSSCAVGSGTLCSRVPYGQPKPDSFYKDVARVFSDLSMDSARPAAVISEANGVPVSTVHGWVKEARRRGFLSPGERQARRKQ